MDVMMKLPDLATNDSGVTVVRWLVEVGQPVKRGEPLVEVETDKSVMEVESVVTGTLRSVAIAAGEQAVTGQVIALFDAEGGAAPEPVRAPVASAMTTTTAVAPPRPKSAERVSFFARNRQARKATPDVIPLAVAQRTLARRMGESKRNAPHFYLQTSADAGPMTALRASTKGQGGPIAWDAFFVYAASRALARFPRMGYRFEDDRLVPQGTDAVNVAVDLDGELFTVAVDGPAGKSPAAISDEIRAGVDRLKSGDPHARVGRRGNLTITNLGGSNVETFVAVINPPEASILAVGKVSDVVVVVDGAPAVRGRVNLCLSVDHRVVNGKYAAGFLGAIVEGLEAIGTDGGATA